MESKDVANPWKCVTRTTRKTTAFISAGWRSSVVLGCPRRPRAASVPGAARSLMYNGGGPPDPMSGRSHPSRNHVDERASLGANPSAGAADRRSPLGSIGGCAGWTLPEGSVRRWTGPDEGEQLLPPRGRQGSGAHAQDSQPDY